jgi:hypothetical protein
MNRTRGTSPAEIRHRLLEGVLLRLARLPDATDFVLRGGMLMRLWFRPLDRPSGDIDLAATFPFDAKETARRLVPLLADRGVDDGVVFDAERVRVEGIWLDTPFPGVRMFAAGTVDGIEDEFSLDVTFSEQLVPEPTTGDYLTSSSCVARLRMCRPETIVGRKLHALMHMGALHWRAKDLNDVRLLLKRVLLDSDALVGAIASSFTTRGNTTADARALFRHKWWTLKTSAVRWQDLVASGRVPGASGPLARVVAEVAEQLEPILGRLP